MGGIASHDLTEHSGGGCGGGRHLLEPGFEHVECGAFVVALVERGCGQQPRTVGPVDDGDLGEDPSRIGETAPIRSDGTGTGGEGEAADHDGRRRVGGSVTTDPRAQCGSCGRRSGEAGIAMRFDELCSAERNEGELLVGTDPQRSVVIGRGGIDRDRIDSFVELAGEDDHAAPDRCVVAEAGEGTGAQGALEVLADEVRCDRHEAMHQ